MIAIVIDALGTVTKWMIQGLQDLEVRGSLKTIPNYSIINISQTTEECLGDLGRLSVTWTPVRKQWQMQEGKTQKGVNNNNSSLGFWNANESPFSGQKIRRFY